MPHVQGAVDFLRDNNYYVRQHWSPERFSSSLIYLLVFTFRVVSTFCCIILGEKVQISTIPTSL